MFTTKPIQKKISLTHYLVIDKTIYMYAYDLKHELINTLIILSIIM